MAKYKFAEKTMNTKRLKRLSVKELTKIANSFALKLMGMQEQGLREDPRFKRLALELYHISEIIRVKEEKYHKGLENSKKNNKKLADKK